MSDISNFLVRFFKYMFLGFVEQRRDDSVHFAESEVPIDEVDIEPHSQEQVKNRLIITINWVLVVVCGISFIFIVVYLLVYPDKSVPDVIQNAFFTTLGWFGGALGTFFQIGKDQK